MSLQDFINSAFAIKTGMWVARTLPPKTGYRLADAVTAVLAGRRKSAMIQATAENQRMVLGPDASEAEVERAVRANLRHAGRANYDLYRALSLGKEAIVNAITVTPRGEEVLQALMTNERGAVVVSCHLGNFDIAALSFATRNHPTMLLAFPAPTSGYDVQNEIRREWGLDMQPIGVGALRKALRHLKGGGLLATGVDRPDPFGSGEMLPFFGKPARLPVGHVRLALQAGSPLSVGISYRDPARPHHYLLDFEPPMLLKMVGDRQETTIYYARKVLETLEDKIRTYPDQWLMSYPIWTDPARTISRAPAFD